MLRKVPKVLIELRPSKIDKGGVGVFAVGKIKKGERIVEGIHAEDYKYLVPWQNFKKYDSEVQKKIKAFCVGTLEGFIPPEKIDFNLLSIDWYFNHSCNGNVGFNKDGDFVARRNIKKGEELSYDYGLVESNPNFKMVCKCKSKNCRKVITGNDWKNKDFRKKNLSHMLPALRKLHI